MCARACVWVQYVVAWDGLKLRWAISFAVAGVTRVRATLAAALLAGLRVVTAAVGGRSAPAPSASAPPVFLLLLILAAAAASAPASTAAGFALVIAVVVTSEDLLLIRTGLSRVPLVAALAATVACPTLWLAALFFILVFVLVTLVALFVVVFRLAVRVLAFAALLLLVT